MTAPIFSPLSLRLLALPVMATLLVACGGGGGGGEGSATPQSTVTGYAYAANSSDNTISQFGVSSTGALAAIGPSLATSATPVRIATEPSGKFAYVITDGNHSVTVYSIGTDGRLTAVVTPPVVAGTEPFSIAFSSSGNFAYVVDRSSDTVIQYAIDPGTGVLSFVRTTATGDRPAYVVFDRTGAYAYVTNEGDDTVSQYTVDTSTGVLTPMSPTATVATGDRPSHIVVTGSSTQYVYVANFNSNSISEYRIGTSGQLEAPATVTVSSGAAASPSFIAVHPLGFVYVGDIDHTGNIYQFSIDGSGHLVPLSVPVVTLGQVNSAIAFDSLGQHAYVSVLGSPAIYTYTIGNDGALTSAGSIVNGTGVSSFVTLTKTP